MFEKWSVPMKDLFRLARHCKNDLLSVGIRCGNVRSWSVNSRAKARWGLCKKVGRNIYDIQIAEALLQDNVSDQAAKDTIAHELIHTVPGCFSHTGKWKQLADRVNQLLPQYQIRVKSSFEEKGLEDNRPIPEFRYLLKCQLCGKEIHRQKKTIVVEHPEHYRCTCGGKLVRIK